MFDHIGIAFRDLKSSGSFYNRVIEQINLRLLKDHTQPDGTGWLVFGSGASEAPFFANKGDPGVRRGR